MASSIFAQFDDEEEASPGTSPDALFAPENNPLLPQDEHAEHLRAYANLFEVARKAETIREAGRSIGREVFANPPLAFQPDDPTTLTEAEAVMRATRPRTPHFLELFHPQLAGGIGQGMRAFGEGFAEHDQVGIVPNIVGDIGAALAKRGQELAENAPPLQVPSYTVPLESFRKGEVGRGLAETGTYIYEQIGRGAGTAAPMFAAGAVAGVPGVVLAGWNMGIGQMRTALAEEMEEYTAKADVAERSGDMAGAAAYRAIAARLNPDNQAKVIYAAGSVIGLLDAMLPGQMIIGSAKLNVALKELTARYVISTIAKGMAAGSLKEGITEALQGATEVIGIAHVKGADHAAAYMKALADNSDRILEEGVAGAAAGLGFGVVEGGGRVRRQQDFIEEQRPPAMEVARATPIEAEPNIFERFDEAQEATEPAAEPDAAPATEAQTTEPPRVVPDVPAETRTELLEVAEAAGITRETPDETLADMVDLRREGASFSAPFDRMLDEAIAEAEAEIAARPPVTPDRVQTLETQAEEAQAQIASLKERVAVAEGEDAAKLRQELEDTQARLTTAEQELAAVREENAAFDRLRAYVEAGGSVSPANARKAAKAAGVRESQLRPLLDRAVSEGVLRKDRRGKYRRTPETAAAALKVDPRDPNPVPAAVQSAIRAMMPRLPKGTRVKTFATPSDLPQRLASQVEGAPGEVDALFDDVTGDIFLSRAALDPQGRIGHEGIHALRSLDRRLKEQGLSGLFTDAEWNALVERANKVKGLFDRQLYERLFRERGYTEQQLKDALDEEAVAHLYEARVNGASYGKRLNGLLDRIRELFERIGNYLRGQGFQSAGDVMAAIDSGEIAGRVPDAVRQEIAAGEAMFAKRPTLSIPGLKEVLDAKQERARTADAQRELRRPFPAQPQLSEWMDLPSSEFTANLDHIAAKRKAKDGPGLGDLTTPEAVRAHIEDVLANGSFAYLYRTEDGTDSLNLVKLGEPFDSVVAIRLRSERGRLFIPTAFNQLPHQTVERLGRSVDLNGADSLKWQKTQAARREILKRIAQAPAEVQGSSWHELRRILRQNQEQTTRSGGDGTMFSLRQAQDPVRGMASIIRDLVHDMGITVRQGRGRGRFLGFNPDTGVIRQRSYYDIQALAQNAGRALEHRFGAPFAKILDAHADDLTLPPAPNAPAPRLSPTGFSGLELDAGLQSLAVEAAMAGREVRQLAAQVGQAKASPRVMPGRARVNPGLQARYEAAQRRAGEARRRMVRRLGDAVVRAIDADISRRMPDPLDPTAPGITDAELAAYVAQRFSATGTPQPAAQTPQPSREELSDAFADWMQLYLTNPALAERQAPGLYDAFEDHVDDIDPVLLAKLQDTQTAIEELQKAAPGDMMQSMIAPADRLGAMSQLLSDASRDGILPTLGHRLTTLYTAIFDKTHPMYLAVQRLLEVHEANTGQRIDLPAIENAYKLIRLAASSHSWAGRDMQDGIRPRTGVEGEGPSLTEALRIALGDDRAEAVDMSPGSRYRQFGAYLVARRAVKLWERYNNGLLPNPPTLQSEQAARDAITEFEGKFPEFARGAAMVYEFQRNLLRLQRDAGLISEEQYDTLLMDDDYVPFLRTFDELGDPGTGPTSVRGKTGIIKRLKGSNRDIIDPIASIAQKVYDTRQRIAVNDSLRALIKLAETAGPGGGAIAERLDPTRAKPLTVNALDALRNAAKAAGVDEADAQAMAEMAQDLIGAEATATVFTQQQITEGREPIVWMLEDGKPVPIRLSDGWLGGAILDLYTTFGNQHSQWIIEAMAVPTQFVRGTITSNPSFILRNMFVDGLLANMYEARAWPWLTQVAGFVDAVREARNVRRYAATAGLMGGPATSGLDRLRFDRNVRELVEKGYEPKVWSSPKEWMTAMLDSMGADTRAGRIRLAAGVGLGAVVGGPHGALAGAGLATLASRRGRRTLTQLSEASETGTRARLYDIAFRRAKAQGLDDAAAATEAAFFAHDYIDYSRHGSKTEPVRKLVAFFNAALQGMDRYFRLLAAKGDYGSAWGPYFKHRMKGGQLTAREKAEVAQSAYAWFVTVGVFGSLSALIAALWGDDERVREIPDEMRATHWIIPLDGVTHIVPKEFPGLKEWTEQNLKHQAVRLPKPFETTWFANLVERTLMDMRQNDPRWFEGYVMDLWETMTPPVMPQAVEIPFEMIAGKSFFTGRDIVPKWKQDRLIERQFDEYTSEFAKWLGPQIGVSPFYVDHGLKALGTSWGRDFLSLNVPGTPWYDPNKPDKSVDDYFIARRFLWKVGKASESGQAVREIMGAEDPIRIIWGRIAQPYSKLAASGQTYKDYMTADDPASAIDLLDRLTPKERGYAILAGHFTDGNAKYRMLHPMNRAERVMREVIGLQKEILSDRVMSGKKTRTEKPIPLNPSEKAAARDILLQIQMAEARNALVLTGEIGWERREMFDTSSMLDELKAAVPSVAREYEARLKKAKVLPFDGVERVWPDVQRKLESDDLLERIRQGRTSGLTSLLAVEYARARTGGGRVLREPEPATAN